MSTYTSTSEVIEQLLLQSFYVIAWDILDSCNYNSSLTSSNWVKLITIVIAMWVMEVKKSVRAPLHNKIYQIAIFLQSVIYLETPGDHHNDHC